MLSLPTSVRIYLARGATDMRKSIDGLSAVTTQVLEQDPFSGHLFVFCNRRRDRIKILYWEQSGFWLLHKRLEKGTFAWPLPAALPVSEPLRCWALALPLAEPLPLAPMVIG